MFADSAHLSHSDLNIKDHILKVRNEMILSNYVKIFKPLDLVLVQIKDLWEI